MILNVEEAIVLKELQRDQINVYQYKIVIILLCIIKQIIVPTLPLFLLVLYNLPFYLVKYFALPCQKHL